MWSMFYMGYFGNWWVDRWSVGSSLKGTRFSWKYKVFFIYVFGCGISICNGFFFVYFVFVFPFQRFTLSIVSLTFLGILANPLIWVTAIFLWDLCFYQIYCCCFWCCCCCGWLDLPTALTERWCYLSYWIQVFSCIQECYIPSILYFHGFPLSFVLI